MVDSVKLFAEQRRRAIELRRKGLTYEEITETLNAESPPLFVTTPWFVYSECNPGKSPAQIAAWADKHHPDPLEFQDTLEDRFGGKGEKT